MRAQLVNAIADDIRFCPNPMQSSPIKSPGAEQRESGFLSALRYDGDSYAAFLDVVDRVPITTLRKNGIAFRDFYRRLPDAYLQQERFRIEPTTATRDGHRRCDLLCMIPNIEEDRITRARLRPFFFISRRAARREDLLKIRSRDVSFPSDLGLTATQSLVAAPNLRWPQRHA
jgi:hypothetical protein